MFQRTQVCTKRQRKKCLCLMITLTFRKRHNVKKPKTEIVPVEKINKLRHS